MFRRNQIRLRLLSKYNHCTLDNLPTQSMFQCSKCRKFNTVFPPLNNNNNNNAVQLFLNCLFCGQPNYTRKPK